ncbi:MAG: BatD family protein [Thermoanaerobaculia bacterium]
MTHRLAHSRTGRNWHLAAIALLASAHPATAQGIRAQVDRTEATVEDRLVLTITIEGSRSAQPELPELPDFEVVPGGQSTQMSFVNGRASSSISHSFFLIPKRPGSFTIEPATVELDGRRYASRPITVRILEPSAQPSQPRDLFLTVRVSTTKPYVGQQVTYAWRFYRRVQIDDARLEPLKFAGFAVEDLGDVREYESTINGVSYLVSELRKVLFPQEEGQLTIPASRLTCEVAVRSPRRRHRSLFEDFFGTTTTQTKVLRSREITLNVQPRPAPPRGFSGLVGDFTLVTEVSKRDLKVGESATLRLTVKGSGNVQMIAEPELPELPSFKIYDDKPEGSIQRSGSKLTGYRSYPKALVPLAPGEPIIPPVSLVYFDPDSGSYRTTRTAPIALRVAPADGREELRLTESLAPGTGKVAVRILADDILPIYKGLDTVAPATFGQRSEALLTGALLAPPLLFLSTLIAHRRRRRFLLDAGLRRRREALRSARRRLKEVGREVGRGDPRSASRAASRCLREFIGDKLNLEGSALTPEEAAQHLCSRGLEEGLLVEVRRLLQRLEAAQYGAAEIEPERFVETLEAILKRLEGAIRS